ncbi:MAG: Mannosyl-glycoprotein endo-beta-N-acetylglucosaminidase [Bacteroidota bacterium]|nr:Mannosyl-glycoprotein endo-beta-N-acetylglucosaminidase [Bacteroidota bacterium]
MKKPVGFYGCLLMLLLISARVQGQTRLEKVSNLYDSLLAHDIEKPKTVLAIAIFETGWMECHHCTYRENNLFGFRNNGGYVKFKTISDCLDFLRHWQDKYYVPWKKKHHKGTYYDFLRHMRYAVNMTNYIHTIMPLERWIEENVDAAK